MTTPASLERQHTLATAVARYDELRMRDLLAPGADDLPAEEQPEPGPLSQQEALELLALSEIIARNAFPDAGYRYHLLGPSVGPLVPASP